MYRPYDRKAWLGEHLNLAANNGTHVLPDSDKLRDRIISLDERFVGKVNCPIFVSSIALPAFNQGIYERCWYGGEAELDHLQFNYVSFEFCLPIYHGWVASSSYNHLREWIGEIPLSWYLGGMRKNSSTPLTVICIGEEEIEKFLSQMDVNERNRYRQVSLDSFRRRGSKWIKDQRKKDFLRSEKALA